MANSKAIVRTTEAVTMEVEQVIKGVFISAEMAHRITKMVAKMLMLFETGMTPMRNVDLVWNGLYLLTPQAPVTGEQLVAVVIEKSKGKGNGSFVATAPLK